MAFCTKCGQPLIEGQPHYCPYTNNQTAQNSAVGFDSDANSIGVSIDTDKMKDSYRSFKGKIAQAGGGNAAMNESAKEDNMLIVPECICANSGEVPIKQYNIAQLRSRIIFSKANGRLQVTNKRIIFRAVGRSLFGRVQLHQEFKIDEIAGVEFRNNQVFNVVNFFVGLILGLMALGVGIACALAFQDAAPVIAGLLGIVAIAAWIFVGVIFAKSHAVRRFYLVRLLVMNFVTGMLISSGASFNLFSLFEMGRESDNFWIGFSMVLASVALIIVLINLFLYSFVPNLTIKIKTKGSFPGIDLLKEPQLGLFSILFGTRNEENSGFLEVNPWLDTSLANKELGTMIDDIQTLGDAAIEKWRG